MSKLMKIQHNLEVAKPSFLSFIENMKEPLAKWIQYNGCSVEGSQVLFNFKSSQNSLRFQVYAGVNTPNIHNVLNAHTNEIYEYFRSLKYDSLSK